MSAKTSQNYTRLLNDGPQTYAELPGQITRTERSDGLKKFKPRASGHGSAVSGGGNKLTVYYIEHKHDPKTVIKKWVDANEKTVESISTWALHQRISKYGKQWKEASREVLGPFDLDVGGDQNAGGTCPMCGEEYELNLPNHLPCDQ